MPWAVRSQTVLAAMSATARPMLCREAIHQHTLSGDIHTRRETHTPQWIHFESCHPHQPKPCHPNRTYMLSLVAELETFGPYCTVVCSSAVQRTAMHAMIDADLQHSTRTCAVLQLLATLRWKGTL